MSNGYKSSFTRYINLTNIQIQIIFPTVVIKKPTHPISAIQNFSGQKKSLLQKNKWIKFHIILCSYAHFEALNKHTGASVVRHLPRSINRKQELLIQFLAFFFVLFFDWSFSSFHCHNKILKEIKNTTLKMENISPVLCCQDNCIFDRRWVKCNLLSRWTKMNKNHETI